MKTCGSRLHMKEELCRDRDVHLVIVVFRRCSNPMEAFYISSCICSMYLLLLPAGYIHFTWAGGVESNFSLLFNIVTRLCVSHAGDGMKRSKCQICTVEHLEQRKCHRYHEVTWPAVCVCLHCGDVFSGQLGVGWCVPLTVHCPPAEWGGPPCGPCPAAPLTWLTLTSALWSI